jgi:hypothetical protein
MLHRIILQLVYAAVECVSTGGNGPSRQGVVAAATSGMGGGCEAKKENICVYFLALVADRAGLRHFLATPAPPLAPLQIGFILRTPDGELGRVGGKKKLRIVVGRSLSCRRPPSFYWGPLERASGDALTS